MNKWIDLSIALDDKFLPYPGDDSLKLEQTKSIEKDGFNMSKLTTGMHLGTHIDAFGHILDNSSGIEALDIQNLIGEAVVIRPEVVEGIIQTDSIKKAFIKDYQIVILDFEHGKKLNTSEYYKQPKFQTDIVDFLKLEKVEVLAFNLPSPEYLTGDFLQMHRDLFTAGIYVIENLSNLDKLDKIVDFIALPLNIPGLDGSMVRAVARNR